jgi:hypothetical protein
MVDQLRNPLKLSKTLSISFCKMSNALGARCTGGVPCVDLSPAVVETGRVISLVLILNLHHRSHEQFARISGRCFDANQASAFSG